MKLFPLLFIPKILSFKNSLNGKKIVNRLPFVLLGVIFWIFVYTIFCKILLYFKGIEIFGDILAAKLLSMIFLSFLFFLIMSSIITNYSANDTRRVDMVVGVSYEDDIDKVRATIRSLIDADDRILRDPECLIAVAELADSSVNFNVRPWVKSGDYWGVKLDLTEAIKKRFDKEGISFPYPQQDVHLYQRDNRNGASAQ